MFCLSLIVGRLEAALSYCVVNTNGREFLISCLEAIKRTHPEGVTSEILVLDNASDDGSVEEVRSRFSGEIDLIIPRKKGWQGGQRLAADGTGAGAATACC